MSNIPLRPDRRYGSCEDERLVGRSEGRNQKRRTRRFGFAFVVAIVVFSVMYAIGLAGRGRTNQTVAVEQQQEKPQSPGKPVVFASVSGSSVMLVLPAPKKDIIGIGYHQAYNQRALSFEPMLHTMDRATTEAVMKTLATGHTASFIMDPRGRGTASDSAVDVALPDHAVVKSPVTGRVGAVVPYLLYGRINDVRIDIMPDGDRNFQVAIIHIEKPMVTAGQRVVAGKTPLAAVRDLGIKSQIDEYLGKAVAHVHIQANPIEDSQLDARAN